MTLVFIQFYLGYFIGTFCFYFQVTATDNQYRRIVIIHMTETEKHATKQDPPTHKLQKRTPSTAVTTERA